MTKSLFGDLLAGVDVALFERTLERWGEQGQYDQAIEECNELAVALLHFRRGKAVPQQVIDELADVALMVAQLSWMFGPAAVAAAAARKCAKLEALLAAESV
ncbi:antitoxin [Desulfuromonas thiophila]|uniref:antitoxin n=1 Tax=Desulfuromonas thiophila TaxID=57664 RepID=UPI0024A89258|nr:antitoxin [Desulfuromonas thiophila]